MPPMAYGPLNMFAAGVLGSANNYSKENEQESRVQSVGFIHNEVE